MSEQTLKRQSTNLARIARGSGSRSFKLPPLLEVAIVWGLVSILVPLIFEGSSLFLATTVVVYALFALSVSVLFGWTGISSFGQAAFFGAGAYTVGLVKDTLESPILVIVLAAVVAALLALIFAVMASRVTGIEFAMLTLVLAQIVWLLTFQIDPLGGENGIPGIPRGEIFGVNMFDGEVFWWYVIGIVAVGTYLLRRLSASSLGMSMNAVRDDPVRASALGINVRVVRILAFTIAGMAAGAAGGLLAQQQGLVSPDMLFWALSGEVIVMCLIGGLHHFWGAAIGALILIVTNWFLLDLVASPAFYVGLALLLVVLLLPGGIAGIPEMIRRRTTKRRVNNARKL